jgi:hypothetical protein
MARQIEPCIRTVVMGDITRYLSSVNTAPVTSKHDTGMGGSFVMVSPNLSSIYLKNLGRALDIFFNKNKPLKDILEGLYAYQLSHNPYKLTQFSEKYPALFDTNVTYVLAETKLGEAFFRAKLFDEVLQFNDIFFKFEKQHMGQHKPISRENLRQLEKVNEEIKRYLEMEVRHTRKENPSSHVEYNKDYIPV